MGRGTVQLMHRCGSGAAQDSLVPLFLEVLPVVGGSCLQALCRCHSSSCLCVPKVMLCPVLPPSNSNNSLKHFPPSLPQAPRVHQPLQVPSLTTGSRSGLGWKGPKDCVVPGCAQGHRSLGQVEGHRGRLTASPWSWSALCAPRAG